MVICPFSCALGLVTVVLPMRVRTPYSFALSKIRWALIGHSERFLAFAMKAKRIGRNEVPIRSDNVSLPEQRETRACVLFSGGSDSTLTAVRLLEKFDQVHLLTFSHPAIPEGGRRSLANSQRLKARYGESRVVHRIVDISSLLGIVYSEQKRLPLAEFDLFARMNYCGACKIAMYLAVMKYCLSNGIPFFASGANNDGADIISDQMVVVSDFLRDFFGRYGIRYCTPVYNVGRTDWVLHELGVTDARNTKSRATRKASVRQAYCDNAFPYTIWAKGYFVPLHGQRSLEKISLRLFKEMVRIFENKVPSLYIAFDGESMFGRVVLPESRVKH